MNLGRSKVLLLVAAVFAFALSAYADGVIYSQPYDGLGVAYSSQNDTTGGNGDFATAYDDFTLSGSPTGAWSATDLHWTGLYFNPGPPGTITDFTIKFYQDNGAGAPGGTIQTIHTHDNAGESCNGAVCTYSATFDDIPLQDGVIYWVSVEPDMGFPPQWGWATSAVGDGHGYQCFFGSCGQIGGVNFAFDLTGVPEGGGVPEPGTLVMLGTGVLGLAGTLRRKLF